MSHLVLSRQAPNAGACIGGILSAAAGCLLHWSLQTQTASGLPNSAASADASTYDVHNDPDSSSSSSNRIDSLHSLKAFGALCGSAVLTFMVIYAATKLMLNTRQYQWLDLLKNGHRLEEQKLSLTRKNVPRSATIVVDRKTTSEWEMGTITDAPMWVLPPFEPTCFPRAAEMHRIGCPVMDCLRDPDCTVFNTSCCAYMHMEMLTFIDTFMASKCLDSEWLLLYGSALGAVRNATILPHTEDLDMGVTPLALQFLELNSTKEELWRHGYVFWHHLERGVWKLCPHLHHPSPHFQVVMMRNETLTQWEERNGKFVAGYVDMWIMWPAPSDADCTADKAMEEDPWGLEAMLNTPWDNQPRTSLHDVSGCSFKDRLKAPRMRSFCSDENQLPFVWSPTPRRAAIAGRPFPIADNAEELFRVTYGGDWSSPNKTFHGSSATTPDATKLKELLLEKLSVTAWGDMHISMRKSRCAQRQVGWENRRRVTLQPKG